MMRARRVAFPAMTVALAQQSECEGPFGRNIDRGMAEVPSLILEWSILKERVEQGPQRRSLSMRENVQAGQRELAAGDEFTVIDTALSGGVVFNGKLVGFFLPHDLRFFRKLGIKTTYRGTVKPLATPKGYETIYVDLLGNPLMLGFSTTTGLRGKGELHRLSVERSVNLISAKTLIGEEHMLFFPGERGILKVGSGGSVREYQLLSAGDTYGSKREVMLLMRAGNHLLQGAVTGFVSQRPASAAPAYL